MEKESHQKIMDKIFQPFFTTKAAGQGTGLGLPLARSLIRLHGGELTITSVKGQGTAVTVTLPPDRLLRTAA